MMEYRQFIKVEELRKLNLYRMVLSYIYLEYPKLLLNTAQNQTVMYLILETHNLFDKYATQENYIRNLKTQFAEKILNKKNNGGVTKDNIMSQVYNLIDTTPQYNRLQEYKREIFMNMEKILAFMEDYDTGFGYQYEMELGWLHQLENIF